MCQHLTHQVPCQRQCDRRIADDGAGLLLTLRDVTSRRKTTEALKESEARFSAAFHGSPASLAIYNIDGRLVEANEAFCASTGKASVPR